MPNPSAKVILLFSEKKVGGILKNNNVKKILFLYYFSHIEFDQKEIVHLQLVWVRN